MTPMTCTRTLPLHSDSSVRPTTRDPAHTLQTQSRCSIVALTPYSSPRLPRPPPHEKQQKLNYSKLTTETAFLTNAEGEKKKKKNTSHHVSPSTAISPLSPSLAASLFLRLDRRSERGIPHTLVLRRGITSTLLSLATK